MVSRVYDREPNSSRTRRRRTSRHCEYQLHVTDEIDEVLDEVLDEVRPNRSRSDSQCTLQIS